MKILEKLHYAHIDDSFIDPKRINTFLMIRIPSYQDSFGQVCVIGIFDEEKGILIEQGNLSFDGNNGGSQGCMNNFADWLKKEKLFGRVEKELFHMEKDQYQNLIESEKFDRKMLFDNQSQDAKSSERRFQAWLNSDKNWENK